MHNYTLFEGIQRERTHDFFALSRPLRSVVRIFILFILVPQIVVLDNGMMSKTSSMTNLLSNKLA